MSLGLGAKRDFVQSACRYLTAPLVASTIHAVAPRAWHAPWLFQATLTSEAVHVAPHAGFLFSPLPFRWALFYEHGRSARGTGVLYVFTTAVQPGVPGALPVLSPSLWFADYAAPAPDWGLTGFKNRVG